MLAPLLVIALAAAPTADPPDTSYVPDPNYCTVVPCDQMLGILTTPFHGTGPEVTRFVVTVLIDPVTPVPNAFVEIIMMQPGSHFCCPNVQLSGITNAEGQVTFNLSMGGCALATQAVRILANGVVIRIYPRLLSPDYDGLGDGEVSLTDFAFFGAAYIAGAPGCTDYYNDGATGIDDFSGFGACWGRSCAR